MPSNDELALTINELADELGEETPDLNGMGNTDRVNLAKEMRARLKAKGDEPIETEEAKAAEETAPVVVSGYVVAKGKSITSRKGILDAGEKVEPDHLNGGAAAFVRLRDRKVIVKA